MLRSLDAHRDSCRRGLLAVVAASALALPGCQWCQTKMDQLKGNGFPEWSDSMGSARGDNSDAKPSGFFTDRRSEQIERNLGGGF